MGEVYKVEPRLTAKEEQEKIQSYMNAMLRNQRNEDLETFVGRVHETDFYINPSIARGLMQKEGMDMSNLDNVSKFTIEQVNGTSMILAMDDNDYVHFTIPVDSTDLAFERTYDTHERAQDLAATTQKVHNTRSVLNVVAIALVVLALGLLVYLSGGR